MYTKANFKIFHVDKNKHDRTFIINNNIIYL